MIVEILSVIKTNTHYAVDFKIVSLKGMSKRFLPAHINTTKQDTFHLKAKRPTYTLIEFLKVVIHYSYRNNISLVLPSQYKEYKKLTIYIDMLGCRFSTKGWSISYATQ